MLAFLNKLNVDFLQIIDRYENFYLTDNVQNHVRQCAICIIFVVSREVLK